MENTFNFNNNTYIITGASSGIGRSTAISLSQNGAKIVLIGRNEDSLKETLSSMNGFNHMVIPFDLKSSADYTELFDRIVSKVGKLSGVIHCAGIAPIIPLIRLNRKVIEECMTVNFYSFLELVRCISKKRYRSENNISIVEVSSINSIYPEKCQTIYVASKAAANAAIKSLAIELYKNNIRINAVLPGIVNTPMHSKAYEDLDSDNINNKLKKQILGITNPFEIANVIQFLLSDSSTAITGRTIFADGGYLNF